MAGHNIPPDLDPKVFGGILFGIVDQESVEEFRRYYSNRQDTPNISNLTTVDPNPYTGNNVRVKFWNILGFEGNIISIGLLIHSFLPIILILINAIYFTNYAPSIMEMILYSFWSLFYIAFFFNKSTTEQYTNTTD